MSFGTYLANKWIGTRDDVVSELWNLTRKDALSLFLCDFFRILCYGCSIILVLFLIMTNNISLGVFSVCLTAFLNLQDQTRVFLVEVGNLTEELSYASDYFDFLDIDEDSDGTQSFSGLKNQMKAQNVNFCYPINEKDTLNNLNLTVKKGETVVILGENGSGKTTMFKVLFGLYPCKSGQIMYDGSNIDSFIKSDFYQHNSAITQNFVSYNLTLRENITISDIANRLDDEKINRIITDLDLKDTIEELGGLDQQMGRQFCGKELSIGQWQKIAISRALFKESEVIILDEPTSALDPIMESTLLTKFMEIAKDKTTFIISHRVGLCKLADKIIVMKDGSAVEIGSHSELIKLNGIYSELYQMQQKWYQ